ncbi:hypothetical protein K8S19_13365 [bacterium]|nr:hypothetical protein [bacterium]
MVRAFVAVGLTPAVQAALQQKLAQLSKQAPAINGCCPEKLHITLTFLGAVPKIEIIHIRAACEASVAAQKSFAIILGRLDFFRLCHSRGWYGSVWKKAGIR